MIINNTDCHFCTNLPPRETHFSSLRYVIRQLGSMKYGQLLPNKNSKWMAYDNFIRLVTRQRLYNCSECALLLHGDQCVLFTKTQAKWCDSNLVFLMRTKWRSRIAHCCKLQAYADDRCRACQTFFLYQQLLMQYKMKTNRVSTHKGLIGSFSAHTS